MGKLEKIIQQLTKRRHRPWSVLSSHPSLRHTSATKHARARVCFRVYACVCPCVFVCMCVFASVCVHALVCVWHADAVADTRGDRTLCSTREHKLEQRERRKYQCTHSKAWTKCHLRLHKRSPLIETSVRKLGFSSCPLSKTARM